jgi:hypothetical protein
VGFFKNMNIRRWLGLSRLLALLAGVMDAATGLGLVAAPVLTLRCMLAPIPGAEALLYVRFVGVFVGAVGASYLVALWRGGSGPLRKVFEFTLLFRAGAGLFTGGAVLAGALAPAWFAVTFTDLLLVGLQVWLLRIPLAADE